jgi:DNA-binding NarL/FixJ family response regulator
MALEQQPDIILIDTDSQDSGAVLTLLAALHGSNGAVRPIILADAMDRNILVRAVTLGAVGVVLKDQPPDILGKAIRKVHAGEVWIERALTAEALRRMGNPNGKGKTDSDSMKIATLSSRERDVILGVCQGMQNTMIGQKLAISEATVRHHLTSIYDKLGLKNRVELVTYAMAHNISKTE